MVPEYGHDRSVKTLGPVVLLWVIRRCVKVLDSEIAENGSEELAYKLRTVVHKQVNWDPERDCSMIKKQVRYMRLIYLRHWDRLRELGVSVGQTQDIQFTSRCFQQRNEDVHCDKVEWRGDRE